MTYKVGSLLPLQHELFPPAIIIEFDLTYLGVKPASSVSEDLSVELSSIFKSAGFLVFKDPLAPKQHNVFYTKDRFVLEKIKELAEKRKTLGQKCSRPVISHLDVEEGIYLGIPRCCAMGFVYGGLTHQDWKMYPYITYIPCKSCVGDPSSPTAKLNERYKRALSPYYIARYEGSRLMLIPV
jgi:hypothetical protein